MRPPGRVAGYRKASLLRVLGVLAVVALAVFVRLHDLDARGVHFDEGVHAYYSWEFLTSGEFTYEPWRHGPFLYYLSVGFMKLLGTSILTGRTAVALVSLGMFPALYLMREELSRPALRFSALMLAVHPYVVSTARFYRNDVLLATFCLLAVGCYARYYRTGEWYWAVGIGVTVGLAFAAKEAAFLVLPAILLPILVVMHFHARFETGSIRETVSRFLPPRYLILVAAGVAAVIVLLFGGWPLEPADSFPKFSEGITYWLSAGQSEDGTVTFYLDWIVAGTPVLSALAVAGVVATLVRPDSEWFRWIFLAWAGFVASILSLIGDQSWWNVVLLFPPIALLAGYGFADVWLGVTALLSRVRRRLDTHGVAWVPSPNITPSTRQVIGTVVLPVAVSALVLGVVTGAIATPTTVAGLDHPNRTTEIGIEGVTVPDRPDSRDLAFQAAREAAMETGCPGVIGPGVYEWPAKWWFRGIDHDRVTNLNATHLPAVVVTAANHPLFDQYEYGLVEFDGHRVYVPPQDCE